MIYVYLVLGCWLKFVFPEMASITDGIWTTMAWTTFGVMAAVSAYMLYNPEAVMKATVTKRFTWTQYALVGASGMLTGHPVATIAVLFSIYTFDAIFDFFKKRVAEK